ncbi:hypothetical protein EVAR_19907_1 [Eumeta japonica]|uniref:Uncharacterized protein n=1 Tax=Eumeta variegata TaxID=151549 RepID=A0A4C1ZGV6_EUMVA|nr:hypothetical protein EVAR_19907_1 [Eumeta japonica]
MELDLLGLDAKGKSRNAAHPLRRQIAQALAVLTSSPWTSGGARASGVYSYDDPVVIPRRLAWKRSTQDVNRTQPVRRPITLCPNVSVPVGT